jgi:hypothetical protein
MLGHLESHALLMVQLVVDILVATPDLPKTCDLDAHAVFVQAEPEQFFKEHAQCDSFASFWFVVFCIGLWD